MHKKLEAELVSLAHSILQMKNKEDVIALHKKAQDVVEKLALLKFVNNYINTTPQASETKEEIIEKIATVVDDKDEIVETENITIETVVSIEEEDLKVKLSNEMGIDEVFAEDPIFERVSDLKTEEPISFEEANFEKPDDSEKPMPSIDDPVTESVSEVEKKEKDDVEEVVFEKKNEADDLNKDVAQKEEAPEEKEMFTHEEIEKIFNTNSTGFKDDVRDISAIQFTLEDEIKDEETKVETTTVFEKAPEKEVVEESTSAKPKSLNDVLFTQNLQVGLNDRIAFVKYLFDGSQEDFNRVLSQLNSFKSESEAKTFISGFVKPEYNWSEKEEYEERLMNLIERKFM